RGRAADRLYSWREWLGRVLAEVGGATAARLYGARSVGEVGADAEDDDGQDRPAAVARTRARVGTGGVRGAPNADRGNGGRGLGRGSGSRESRSARRFLPAGRPFIAGHAGGQSAAAGVSGRNPAASDV